MNQKNEGNNKKNKNSFKNEYVLNIKISSHAEFRPLECLSKTTIEQRRE